MLNSLVPKIKESDCLVFASPLYFWTISARLKAFIEQFYCVAIPGEKPPLGRYEKYPIKDMVLLVMSADNFFGHLNRRNAITNLLSSIISASTIKECFWPEAVATPTVNLKLKKLTGFLRQKTLYGHCMKMIEAVLAFCV